MLTMSFFLSRTFNADAFPASWFEWVFDRQQLRRTSHHQSGAWGVDNLVDHWQRLRHWRVSFGGQAAKNGLKSYAWIGILFGL
jgi:hypothetical protein